jgi:hypothetical protein
MSDVIMPKELSAENGAKKIMIGELFIEREIENPIYCGCGNCDYCRRYPDEPSHIVEKITIPWTTIKDIYKLAVNKLSKPLTES